MYYTEINHKIFKLEDFCERLEGFAPTLPYKQHRLSLVFL